jgi:hypothetical protein
MSEQTPGDRRLMQRRQQPERRKHIPLNPDNDRRKGHGRRRDDDAWQLAEAALASLDSEQ